MCQIKLLNYLTTNNLLHQFQSAYMLKKSTETALTKISSDLLSNLDNKHGSVLALLDLSAAFDTINHCILIKRLHEIGNTDIALSWLTSCITGRTTSISIENHSSPARTTTHSVPQWSVLGHILFNIYISHLPNTNRQMALDKFSMFQSHQNRNIIYAHTRPLHQYLPSSSSPLRRHPNNIPIQGYPVT